MLKEKKNADFLFGETIVTELKLKKSIPNQARNEDFNPSPFHLKLGCICTLKEIRMAS